MRLSRTEVRDVSPAGARGGRRASRIAIASESKQAGGVSGASGAQIILPPGAGTHTPPVPAHTSFERASLWRRPGPCMILVRARLISGRLKLTRRRRAREIKTGCGPEGAAGPRSREPRRRPRPAPRDTRFSSLLRYLSVKI